MSKTRKVLLILLALALLAFPIRWLLAAMLPDASVDPVSSCVAGMLLSLVTLGLPAWLLRPWTSPRLPRARTALPGMAMGALAAVLIRGGFTMVDKAWQQALNLAPASVPVPESLPLAIVYVAALVIVPALTEEAFFRGALLTGLLDGSRRVTAVLLTALTFVLMHGSLANLPSLLALSLLLTLLMLGSGHIAVPITMHLCYNLTALGWNAIPDWLGGMCCGASVTLGWYLLFCQPGVVHLPMKLRDGLIAAAAVIALILSYLL